LWSGSGRCHSRLVLVIQEQSFPRC
jgi:hypothetical protein